MNYDRQITISSAGSRRAAIWPPQRIMLSELYEKLKTPVRSTETLDRFLSMKKSQQDDLKDVGGFVAGSLRNGRRRANCVAGRDVLALDLDNVPAGGTADILRRVDGLTCGYCVYSTRKHSPAAPRLRVLLPLDRTVTADEYEPIARMAAKLIDADMAPFDPSTFEPSRLMYWPSCCSDGEYVYQTGDKPFLSADGVLAMYVDWRDFASWPQVPGAQPHAKLADKQGDPTEKKGIVGAFCRVYDIYGAMEQFLPDVYTPTDQSDRYTYAKGSTTGGAIVYEGGRYLFSHHATDPAGGYLCNAFDLVRRHLYGDLDDDAKPDTPVHKLPSFKAMTDRIRQDPQVVELINRERYEQAVEDFEPGDSVENDVSWMRKLKVSESGRYDRTIYNAAVMLKYDPRIRDRIRLNDFSGRIEGLAPLPWPGRKEKEGPFEWANADDAGLRDCVEQLLGFHVKDTINDALVLTAEENRYNPVQSYLRSLQWDGIPRLDTIYQDYFGEEDTPYVRAVSRKSLVAAVARAMEPGVKYDQMVVICGPQGTYKSTFVARLGGEWAASLMVSFDDPKAVAEIIQGRWMVEIPELSSMSKADTNTVKQMVSQTQDEYRAAYDKRAERHPRQCVFFGTTNDNDYLKDPTGNRRFWPIDCGENPAQNVWDDLTPDTVGQIWAEAYVRWQAGEPLILGTAEEREAEQRRTRHTERDDLEGRVLEFLDRPVPENWRKMDAAARDLYLNGTVHGSSHDLVHRDRICVLEVLCECLGWRRDWTVRQADSRRIAKILDKAPGWKRKNLMRFGGGYGSQKGWVYEGKAPQNVNRASVNAQNQTLTSVNPKSGSVYGAG